MLLFKWMRGAIWYFGRGGGEKGEMERREREVDFWEVRLEVSFLCSDSISEYLDWILRFSWRYWTIEGEKSGLRESCFVKYLLALV